MTNIDLIESYAKVIAGTRTPVTEMRTSTRTRLVWFVGIAGYALLNAKPYWEALAGNTITGYQLAWLSLPWVLSALLGVVTHFLVDETATRDDVYFTKKLAAIDLFRIDAKDGAGDLEEFARIADDTLPGIKETKRAVDVWAAWTAWFERATFASLVAGFIWAVVGPLILN